MDVAQCSKLELHKVSARIQDSKGTRLEKKFEDTVNDMNNISVSLKEHVEDLLTLHSLYKQNLVKPYLVQQFIHLRALSRLRARLGAYKHLWKNDFLLMLEHWAPQPEDAPFSIKMQNLYHSHPHWRPTLDSRGYPKAGTGDPNAPYVLFSSTDCQELLGFLARCLRTAVHHAQNNNLDLLIANLRMVHEIVQETAIESLFTKTSLRRVLQAEENHPAVEQFTSRDDGSVEPLEQNYDEDEDERQEIESIEEVDTSRDLASPLRYIRSTTAWCAAIDYFFKPSAPVDMGTFELLIVKRAKLAAKETREEAYKFLRHRLETLRSNEYLERVLSQLEKKFERINIPFTGYVHAEAGLMVYCRNRDPPATLSIGVSKKCCYLCFRLIQRLREHSGGGLWVPGTHGTIYGWSPPPLPIPTDVLRKLEDDLIDVLWMDAEENFSRQNSPATPDKSFRMDFPIADLTVIEY